MEENQPEQERMEIEGSEAQTEGKRKRSINEEEEENERIRKRSREEAKGEVKDVGEPQDVLPPPLHVDQTGGQNLGVNQHGGPNLGVNQAGGPNLGVNQPGGPNLGVNQPGGPNLPPDQNEASNLGVNQSSEPNLGVNQTGGPNLGANQSEEPAGVNQGGLKLGVEQNTEAEQSGGPENNVTTNQTGVNQSGGPNSVNQSGGQSLSVSQSTDQNMGAHQSGAQEVGISEGLEGISASNEQVTTVNISGAPVPPAQTGDPNLASNQTPDPNVTVNQTGGQNLDPNGNQNLGLHQSGVSVMGVNQSGGQGMGVNQSGGQGMGVNQSGGQGMGVEQRGVPMMGLPLVGVNPGGLPLVGARPVGVEVVGQSPHLLASGSQGSLVPRNLRHDEEDELALHLQQTISQSPVHLSSRPLQSSPSPAKSTGTSKRRKRSSYPTNSAPIRIIELLCFLGISLIRWGRRTNTGENKYWEEDGDVLSHMSRDRFSLLKACFVVNDEQRNWLEAYWRRKLKQVQQCENNGEQLVSELVAKHQNRQICAENLFLIDIRDAEINSALAHFDRKDWKQSWLLCMLQLLVTVLAPRLFCKTPEMFREHCKDKKAFVKDVMDGLLLRGKYHPKSFKPTNKKNPLGTCKSCSSNGKRCRTVWRCIKCGPICKKCERNGNHRNYEADPLKHKKTNQYYLFKN